MASTTPKAYRERATDEDRFTLKGVNALEFPGGERFPGGRGDRVRIVLVGVVSGSVYDDSGVASVRNLKVAVDEVVSVEVVK